MTRVATASAFAAAGLGVAILLASSGWPLAAADALGSAGGAPTLDERGFRANGRSAERL